MDWTDLACSRTIGVVLTAACTVWYGAARSWSQNNLSVIDKKPAVEINPAIVAASDPDWENEYSSQLDWKLAVLAPFLSSFALLFFFYFFASLSSFMVLYLCIISSAAVGYVLRPIFASLIRWLGRNLSSNPSELSAKYAFSLMIPLIGAIPFADIFAVLAGLFTVGEWLASGSWWISNAITICLCVSALSLLRFQTLKIAAIWLVGTFLYDVTWNFFSTSIADENIIFTLAAESTENPMQSIADILPFPVPYESPQVQLPNKLMFPDSLSPNGFDPDDFLTLGLGDIVLPGLFIVHIYRVDRVLQRQKGIDRSSSHFYRALAWYAAGLLITITMSKITNTLQPALIYLVPAVLLPLVLRSAYQDDLQVIWTSPLTPSPPQPRSPERLSLPPSRSASPIPMINAKQNENSLRDRATTAATTTASTPTSPTPATGGLLAFTSLSASSTMSPSEDPSADSDSGASSPSFNRDRDRVNELEIRIDVAEPPTATDSRFDSRTQSPSPSTYSTGGACHLALSRDMSDPCWHTDRSRFHCHQCPGRLGSSNSYDNEAHSALASPTITSLDPDQSPSFSSRGLSETESQSHSCSGSPYLPSLPPWSGSGSSPLCTPGGPCGLDGSNTQIGQFHGLPPLAVSINAADRERCRSRPTVAS